MGTHSLIVMRVQQPDGSFKVWCTLYQQFDGYMSGVGKTLFTFLADMSLVNGIPITLDPATMKTQSPKNVANGPGCLFARIVTVMKLKCGRYDQKGNDFPGGAYLCDPSEWISDQQEYNYFVDVCDKTILVKACHGDTLLFEGTPRDALNFNEKDDDDDE
jgi:hypothetical protein